MNYKEFFKEDMLPGGKGDTAALSNFDPKELAMGIKIEAEHTHDERLAKEIAMDHLTEDPHYYTRLNQAGLADELGPDANVSSEKAVVEPKTDDVETKTTPGTVYAEVPNDPSKESGAAPCMGSTQGAEIGGKSDVDSPAKDPSPTDHITGGIGLTPSNPNILPKGCECGDEGYEEEDFDDGMMGAAMTPGVIVGINEGKEFLQKMIKNNTKAPKSKKKKNKKMTKEQWAGDPDKDPLYVSGKRWTVKGWK